MKDLFFSVYIQICMALELIINAAVFMVPLENGGDSGCGFSLAACCA